MLLIWHHLTISCSQQEKKHLARKQYWTNDDVISAAEDFFEDQDESFYTMGIQVLQHQWKKCEDSRGESVKKNTHIWSNSSIAS